MSAGTAGRAAHRRVAAIRSGAVRGMGGPGIGLLYALATPAGPHRPAMLAVATAMLLVGGLTWGSAPRVAASRAEVPVRIAGVLVAILGSALLSLLDGGIASPLGALVPFSLIFLALVTPPRALAVLALVGAAAYWAVALLGAPAPPGYATVFTLAFGGLGYLCVRHAGALVSLRRRLAEVSRADPLTQALNRRGFDERFAAELAEAQRSGEPLTLVFADLDGFKEINDRYGHQSGDRLLTWTADRLAAELRAHDAVGRIGGDEFAVVLSGTGPEGAAVVVERLRESLDGVVPASIGYACFPADAATPEDLWRLADSRAYADKTAGERTLPAPDDVARASDAVDRPASVRRVPRRERRRRSIADMGWIALFDSCIGVFYAVVFAAAQPHRLGIGLIAGAGCVVGGGLILGADRLSRAESARQLMLGYALVMAAVGGSLTALNGGSGTVCALSILVPMPLIALGTPARVAVPILTLYASVYVAVALWVGMPSGWFTALHLVGAVAVSVVCGAQGRAAARQRRRLTELSRADVLTDVLNRRGFEERFTAELAHADRGDRALALLIYDLDGFKRVNDERGHAAGDELLCWVAGTLAANLHPHDAVGRLGGDEFVVLLTSDPAGDAATVAERLRGALAERTSASVGVAVLGVDGEDFDSLYAHADAQLYAEKTTRGGRRRARA
ncbi:GGDEF domain-containing protein [Actinoplanes sp. NPDC049548]|uniref:GGDEF domain-containing protein n=1 Tax=Actinoplanes sp. NPDC049548 TaxID=3155152 RepID=UPI00341D46AF